VSGKTLAAGDFLMFEEHWKTPAASALPLT